jgi:hypothetical protein
MVGSYAAFDSQRTITIVCILPHNGSLVAFDQGATTWNQEVDWRTCPSSVGRAQPSVWPAEMCGPGRGRGPARGMSDLSLRLALGWLSLLRKWAYRGPRVTGHVIKKREIKQKR